MAVQTSLFQYINIDQIIVLLFLLTTLIIGLIASKGIKDTADYSIANKTYGTPVLVLTLLATMIGGVSTAGATAQVFTDGLLYALVLGIGWFVSFMILGRFIASKFDERFEGMLSVSDMVRYFYGGAAEKLSGVLGYIFCIGLFAAQLMVMGNLTANFLNISYFNALIITATLVIAYSIAGGIRAVAITDVFQFAVLIVVVPLIANIATVEAGGLTRIFSDATIESHLRIWDHPKLAEYTAFFIYACLSFTVIYPSMIQRYLMTTSSGQASKISYIYAMLSVALTFMVICMAFSALLLFPEIKPKLIIPTIIDKLLPIGVKGFAIAGMLAVIMSTADSALNTGGILIAHNVLPEKMLKSERTKLNFMKLCTLISGVIALIIAAGNYNITLTILTVETLFIAVGIPLTFGILRFKVNKHCFWACTVANTITFASTAIYGVPEFAIPLICLVISWLSFVVTCYITNNGSILIATENKQIIKEKRYFDIRQYIPTPMNIFKFCRGKVNKVGADYMAFAIFCCINYVVPFFMWTVEKPVHYPVMLSLRLVAGFLCVGLLLKDYWPKSLKKYFPVYWHFTLIFCLSFVTTVMFLITNADVEWLINLSLAIMLLTMLVDWMSFLIISMLGIVTGYVFYTFCVGLPAVNMDFHKAYLLAYVCVFSTMIGIIFARKKEATMDEKLETMQLMGGVMAHEVKSPLSSLHMGVRFISDMILGKAETHIFKAEKVLCFKAEDYEELCNILRQLEPVSTRGIKTVDHLLTSIRSRVVAEDKGAYNLNKCVQKVMREYCTQDEQEKIQVYINESAKFYGSWQYMQHVFINLIKNALKYGGKNVQIEIKLQGNKLIFRDNGKGIAPEILPKIFDRFYTSSSTGTGIGLAFCKMVMEDLGGSITCKSELGKYTEFILTFPKID